MIELLRMQQEDPDLAPMLGYLRDGSLPADEMARKIVLESKQFGLCDVLYHDNPAFRGRWCVVAPRCLHGDVLSGAHAGCFAGHFAERKVYDRLRRYFWWTANTCWWSLSPCCS